MASSLTIRELRAGDGPALLAYLERLSETDRRLRFHGSRVLTDQVRLCFELPEHGGRALVAMLATDEGERCVGEACMTPLPDGTADVALSVGDEVRGGTGALIFEELRRLAGDHRCASVRADVLPRNLPMLRLLRRRGGVVIDRDADQQVAVLVATAPGAPPWPHTERDAPRVLVEAAGGRWAGEHALRQAGVEVAMCAGPSGRADGDPCPLLMGNPCPLVDGADAIVHALPGHDPDHQRVAARLTAEGRPVVPAPGTGQATVGPAEVLQALRPLR